MHSHSHRTLRHNDNLSDVRVECTYRLGYATRRFNQLIYLVKEQLVVKKPERRHLRKTEDSLLLASLYIVIARGCFKGDEDICRSPHLYHNVINSGGAMRDRTADLLDANQALSQLSYSPVLISGNFCVNQGV